MSLAFLPLYFDDEDYEIWMKLKQVEPERRSLYVKEILRKALLDNTGESKEFDSRLFEKEPEILLNNARDVTGDRDPGEVDPREVGPREEGPREEDPGEGIQEEIHPEEVNQGKAGPEDIGQREVNPLEISQVKSISGEGTPPESIPKESSAEIPLVDFSLEDLFIVSPDPQEQLAAERPDPVQDPDSVRPLDLANTSGQMKGLNHLLHQVIGEENDEEVLRFFTRRKEGN